MKEYNFIINGNEYAVSIEKIDDEAAEVTVNGTPFSVEFEKAVKPKSQKVAQVAPNPNAVPAAKPSVAKPAAESSPAAPVKSPLPGVILDILIREGDTVKEGQHLMVLEAMKMENNIDSTRSGVVRTINVSKGDSVLEGDVLITIE